MVNGLEGPRGVKGSAGPMVEWYTALSKDETPHRLIDTLKGAVVCLCASAHDVPQIQDNFVDLYRGEFLLGIFGPGGKNILG